MSLGLVSPLLNRGVRSRWLASLPGAGTKMLTIDSNGDTAFQDVPVAAWGSITGTLSAQTDLQSALDAKLSLTGGTLTGGLSGTTVTTSGLIKGGRFNTGIYEDNTAGFSTYQTSGHFFAGSHATFSGSPIWSFRAGPGYLILNDASNGSQIRSSGQNTLGGVFSIIGSTSTSPSNADHYMGFRFDGAFLSLPLMLGRLGTTAVASANEGAWLYGEASDTLGIRRSTNAQTFRVYNTFTDASNYERGKIEWSSNVLRVGTEKAGTGSNRALELQTDGTTRLAIGTTGNVGIGTTSSNVGLTIRRSGADLPALRLEDGDITVPFTGIGINPTLNANTVGSWSSSASASGGMSFSGFTNNTAASYPLMFEGYTGSASPTKSIISFSGWKTNGTTGATTLASGELLAGFFNGDASGTPVVTISAGGSITAGAGTFSDSSNSTLTVTSSSTNVTTFGVNNSSSAISWGFQVGGSSPLTGAPAGSFTFRQTTNDINAGIIASDGRWLIGSGNPIASTQLAVVSRAASNIVGLFRGAASQTGNLTEWQNSSGSILSRIGIDGAFYGTVFNGSTYSMSAHYSGGFALGPSAGIYFGNSTWPTTGIQSSITFDSPNFSTVGAVALRSGTNTQFFRIYNTFTDASNYIRQSLSFTTYSSTVHAQHVVEGAGTGAVNVPFVITPRGTGAFILGPMPDGTSTGGNARGQNAVDLQTTRSAATQVASGQSSFAAGSRNSATGIYSVAVGWSTTASAEGAFAAGVSCGANSNATFAIGQGAVASGYASAAIGYDCVASGGAAFASGRASSAHSSATQAHSSGVLTNRGTGLISGGSQHILWTLAASTVPNVATEPFTAAAGGTALNVRVVVPNNTLQSGIITINGIRSDGGQCCHFVRKYAVKNIANTVSQLAAAEAIGSDIANGCSIAISANNTTKHIEVLLTAPSARFSGITGSEATDVITLNAHGFVNGEEIAFSGLVGGTGLSNNVLYFVRDATTNTFKVTTGYPSNTATNFTTDITDGSVDYCWNWTVKCNMEETKRGI